jgi:hypothetical protein
MSFNKWVIRPTMVHPYNVECYSLIKGTNYWYNAWMNLQRIMQSVGEVGSQSQKVPFCMIVLI